MTADENYTTLSEEGGAVQLQQISGGSGWGNWYTSPPPAPLTVDPDSEPSADPAICGGEINEGGSCAPEPISKDGIDVTVTPAGNGVNIDLVIDNNNNQKSFEAEFLIDRKGQYLSNFDITCASPDSGTFNAGFGGAFGYVNDRLQSIWDSARLGYNVGGFSVSYNGTNYTAPASTNQVTVGVPVGPATAEASATYNSDEGVQTVTGATGQVTSGSNSVQLGSSGLDTNAPKTTLKAAVEAAAGVLVGFTGTREGNAWTSGAITSDVKTSSDWAQANFSAYAGMAKGETGRSGTLGGAVTGNVGPIVITGKTDWTFGDKPEGSIKLEGTVPLYDLAARPSDLPTQAFLARDLETAHLMEAMDQYSGKGVSMVDVDDGVDLANVDITGNYNAALSWDFMNGDGNPGADTASEGSHSSKMIGIMAGEFTGIAPDATWSLYRTGTSGMTWSDKSVAALQQLDKFDIALTPFGLETITAGSALAADLHAGLAEAAAQGRGGLGTNVVHTAGNSRLTSNNSAASRDVAMVGHILDDSNLTQMGNDRHALTVAASTQSGSIETYSTPGANVLVAACGDQIATAPPAWQCPGVRC